MRDIITGIEMALGRSPDIAVNHDPEAVGTHLAEVRALLTRFGGGDGAALVQVGGELYGVADVGMRMLAPRELFRAQGFADSYVIDPEVDGAPLSKTAQIRMCGNSVCPPLAQAIVEANVTAGRARKGQLELGLSGAA